MKKITLLLVAVAMVLSACGSKLNNENLTKVQNGMTEDQVKVILGTPTRVETGETLGIRGTTYYYESGGNNVKIVFLNNGVMAKEGSFK